MERERGGEGDGTLSPRHLLLCELSLSKRSMYISWTTAQKVLHTHTQTHTQLESAHVCVCASSLTFDFYCQLEGEWCK